MKLNHNVKYINPNKQIERLHYISQIYGINLFSQYLKWKIRSTICTDLKDSVEAGILPGNVPVLLNAITYKHRTVIVLQNIASFQLLFCVIGSKSLTLGRGTFELKQLLWREVQRGRVLVRKDICVKG